MDDVVLDLNLPLLLWTTDLKKSRLSLSLLKIPTTLVMFWMLWNEAKSQLLISLKKIYQRLIFAFYAFYYKIVYVTTDVFVLPFIIQ